jgi:hypothetical protein
VLEVKRSATLDFERQEHDSIEDWYISAVGDSDDYHTEMFDRIFIGNQKVPLWRVLVVAVEEEEAGMEGGDEADAETTPQHVVFSYSDDYVDNVLYLLFTILLLVLVGVFVYTMLIVEGFQKTF